RRVTGGRRGGVALGRYTSGLLDRLTVRVVLGEAIVAGHGGPPGKASWVMGVGRGSPSLGRRVRASRRRRRRRGSSRWSRRRRRRPGIPQRWRHPAWCPAASAGGAPAWGRARV